MQTLILSSVLALRLVVPVAMPVGVEPDNSQPVEKTVVLRSSVNKPILKQGEVITQTMLDSKSRRSVRLPVKKRLTRRTPKAGNDRETRKNNYNVNERVRKFLDLEPRP